MAACAMIRTCAGSSLWHPTTGTTDDIFCRGREVEKCCRFPAMRITVPIWCVGVDVEKLDLPGNTSTRVLMLTLANAVVNFAPVPVTLTTVRSRSRLPPPCQSKFPPSTGGGKGSTAMLISPCVPIESGVGLGSKPCVAINKLVNVVVNRVKRLSWLFRLRRLSVRAHQQHGLSA